MMPETYETSPILAAGCPCCGQPPELVLDSGHQAFCGTEACRVVMWDMYRDPARFLDDAQMIDLSDFSGADG